MCGRVAADHYDTEEFSERYSLRNIDWEQWQSVWNAAPGSLFPVVVETFQGARELVGMRWGLSQKDAHPTDLRPFNARAETVATIPRFAQHLPMRRCIVPASGWYEWRREARRKQPYFARPTDQQVFGFAGLYNAWRDVSGAIYATYCIITTRPTPALTPLHDRMPVVLYPEDEPTWLSKGITRSEEVLPLLRPYERAAIEWWPVGTGVNNVRQNAPDLIVPRADGAELFGTLSPDEVTSASPRQSALF